MLTDSAESLSRGAEDDSGTAVEVGSSISVGAVVDRPLLDYHGVTLTESDLQSLEMETGWLTDNIISFAFNFFEHEHFQDCKQFEFIGPSVVQLLKLCPIEDLVDILTTLKLHERSKRLVFFALNNHDEQLGGGGSHWSLLVLDMKECVLHSYDSLEGVNHEFAEEFLRRLQKAIFGQRLEIRVRKCPQQQNTSDCGMFVILITKAICEHFIGHFQKDKASDNNNNDIVNTSPPTVVRTSSRTAAARFKKQQQQKVKDDENASRRQEIDDDDGDDEDEFTLENLDDKICDCIESDPVENGRRSLYNIIVSHTGRQQQQQNQQQQK